MKISIRDIMFTLVIVATLSGLFYGYKKINEKINAVRVITETNYNGLNFISSGMSLDEQRLRKVLQTERIIAHYNSKLKPEFVHSLAIIIVDASSRYPNIDHLMLCALIAQESKFNPNAVSRAGAKGLTQIMDGTAEMISWRFTWNYYDGIALDPEKNVLMGAWYLDRMIAENKGNVEYALAYYNGGYKYGSLYKMNKIAAGTEFVPDETKQYPGKVFKHYDFMKKTFKFELTNNG